MSFDSVSKNIVRKRLKGYSIAGVEVLNARCSERKHLNVDAGTRHRCQPLVAKIVQPTSHVATGCRWLRKVLKFGGKVSPCLYQLRDNKMFFKAATFMVLRLQ